MVKLSLKYKAQRAEKIEAAKKIIGVADAANREMSADEQKSFDALHSDAAKLRVSITSAELQEAADAEVSAVEPSAIEHVSPNPKPAIQTLENPYADFMRAPAAQPKMYGSLRAAPNAKYAYRFGVWMAAIMGMQWARNKAKDMFAKDALRPEAINNEGTNTQGGYLVIDEFINQLIVLIENAGIARRKCRIVPMTSDSAWLPRRTAGLTAYPVGEGAVGTESNLSWDRVNLVASKWMALTRMTSEVAEDAVINLGDEILRELSYAFAVAEDAALFVGDGTSTYAGITGLKNALAAGAKFTQITSNTWATQVLADINGLEGLLPDYSVAINPEFYCNKAYYHNVLERLAMAGGGNTGMDIVNGIPMGRFFGYPVNFVTSMPKATATTGIVAYFGDLGAAAKFGDRRQLAISMSQEASVGGQSMWERDEIGIKGTERFDIVVHERGTASAGGAINALITG